MNIESLRYFQPDFEEEAVIGKSFQKEELSGNFIAITRKEHTLKAWFLLYGEEEPLEEENEESQKLHRKRKRGTLTNEQQLLSQEKTRIRMLDFLEAIVINERSFCFVSGNSERIMEHSWDAYLLIEHFLNKIPSFDGLEEIELQDMNLLELELEGEYEQIPKECFPNKNGEITIRLENHPVRKRIPSGKKMLFQVGENQETKFTLLDREDKIPYECYINNVYLEDPWLEEEKRFEGENLKAYLKHMTMEEVEEMKDTFYKSLEEYCPRGMYLPVIEYETREDIALDFYSMEYLQEKVKVYEGSCHSMVFFAKPKQEKGLHGGILRACTLSPVSKNTKTISAKLVWYQKKVQVQNIEF